jgi:tetratricopeptide (TPR) repeat protein
MQKILPPNHPKIAGIYNNLGRAHESMENHSKALKYYQKSLEISQKTLPPDHPELVRTKNNTDRLNNKMKK